MGGRRGGGGEEGREGLGRWGKGSRCYRSKKSPEMLKKAKDKTIKYKT